MKPKKTSSPGADSNKAAKDESSARVREETVTSAPDYQTIITIETSKRGGKPCIRGLRITVGDVLGWLAAGMSEKEILSDYPELTSDDIRASLAYAAERENKPKPDPKLTGSLERRLKQMRGFLKGINTDVPRELDRA